MEDDEEFFSTGQQRGRSALSCRASRDPWEEKLRFVIWEAVPDSEIAQEVISDLGVYETLRTALTIKVCHERHHARKHRCQFYLRIPVESWLT